ncbi:SO_0444 family Cu/Zn efflux transporter [Alteromonas sp. A079]|uniref:SO_0444 family Cu/Zn efflux transporter n=1 Tax=Alteromonas sp. A079 TaxID=3410268 RepID=UPI003B9F080A
MTDIILLGQNFLALFMESAPWLLLGLLVAGIMHELVPVSLLEKHMGNNSTGAIAKAAIIGAPLPLCSCGVIPAALGLRRSGASKPSTISFLVSTPETGVDSVSVSYALLGPLFAVVRPVAAIMSAIYAGLMVKWFDEEKAVHNQGTRLQENASCCEKPTPVAPSTCCGTEGQQHEHSDATNNANNSPSNKSSSLVLKVSNVLSYASGKLLSDIVVWLLIGLALAAVIKTFVPTDFLTQWGDGLLAMLVMAVIGVPMYICATASTPLAVGFIAAGLSPGAVLVFLMAGPATNISTMGMIRQEMGGKTLLLYLFSVISASIGFGYLLNYAVDIFSLSYLITTQSSMHEHGGSIQLIYALSALTLAALMIRLGVRALIARRNAARDTHASCCH